MPFRNDKLKAVTEHVAIVHCVSEFFADHLRSVEKCQSVILRIVACSVPVDPVKLGEQVLAKHDALVRVVEVLVELKPLFDIDNIWCPERDVKWGSTCVPEDPA